MRRLDAKVRLPRFLFVLFAAGLALPVSSTVSVAVAASPTYYVALGDSLAQGSGATAGHSYVDDVLATEITGIPSLRLKNLSCGGESTTFMIHGGLCDGYRTGNQLGDAAAFLAAHRGQISFVTIDVGGDDILGCALKHAQVNATCVTKALAAINANLPVILTGLRHAAGNLNIMGMTYYDPILAAYVTGAPFFPGADNQTLAKASVVIFNQLNQELRTIYAQFHVPVADVQAAFKSDDWRTTGSFHGRRVPENVSRICSWTHMCTTAPGVPNIHTNDVGHSVIARQYEEQLRLWTHVPAQT